MKRNSGVDPRKSLVFISIQSIVAIIAVLILTSGCSWLSSRRSLFGDEKEENSQLKTVPKAQYDQLLKKYETLLSANRSEPVSMGDQAATNENELFENKNPEDIVHELNKLEPGEAGGKDPRAELIETVDVFGKNGLARPSNEQKAVIASDYDNVDVHGQIDQLRKAKRYMDQNKMDAALNEFKLLENSPVRQIQVRAKYNIGELLFRQGEFDLAMQVFEDVLQKDAFSGLVIKTLGRLIACSEKLKLKKKQEQYYSILHDFFEES